MASTQKARKCEGPGCAAREIEYPKNELCKVMMEDMLFCDKRYLCGNCFSHGSWIGQCSLCSVWLENTVVGSRDIEFDFDPIFIKHYLDEKLYCDSCIFDSSFGENVCDCADEDNDSSFVKTLRDYKYENRDETIDNTINMVVENAKKVFEMKQETFKDPRRKKIYKVAQIHSSWNDGLQHITFVQKIPEKHLDDLSHPSICCMITLLMKLVELK